MHCGNDALEFFRAGGTLRAFSLSAAATMMQTTAVTGPESHSLQRLHWRSEPPASGMPRQWLQDTGSLTAKLQSFTGGQLKVRVLAEGRCRAAPGHPRPPGSRTRRQLPGLYWQREVVLHAGATNLIRAVTLVPLPQQRLIRRLRLLGSKPLGAFLFAQPGLQRLQMDFAALDWGLARRSWFRIGRDEIVLVEVFLNSLLEQL